MYNPKIEDGKTVHNFCVGSACEHAWFSSEKPETRGEMKGETGEERESTRVPRECALSAFQFSLSHKNDDCFAVYQKKYSFCTIYNWKKSTSTGKYCSVAFI